MSTLLRPFRALSPRPVSRGWLDAVPLGVLFGYALAVGTAALAVMALTVPFAWANGRLRKLRQRKARKEAK